METITHCPQRYATPTTQMEMTDAQIIRMQAMQLLVLRVENAKLREHVKNLSAGGSKLNAAS